MQGANGTALEWALALLQAPGERHALRARPLPLDVDRLLGIAAGTMPEALADAVAAFGEPEARIREAAQFYAREVLFFPQADAYRVLGVERDADDARIKSHHRILQHWLHPDREQSQGDAVFAARVNAAWNQLRSPQRRQAYDATLPASDDGVEATHAPAALGGAPVQAWFEAPESRAGRWRQRLPLLVIGAVCLLFAVLATRDIDQRTQAVADETAPEPLAQAADADMAIRVPEQDLARHAEPQTQARPQARLQAQPRPRASTPAAAALRHSPAPVAVVAAPRARPASIAAPQPARVSEARSAPTQPATKSRSRVPAIDAQPPASAGQRVAVEPPPATAIANTATPASLPSAARIQQARQAGDRLLRFMRSRGRGSPPIWNSPAIESSAVRIRQDLQALGHARIGDGDWRIEADTAVLNSRYAVDGGTAGSGALTAILVWREGQWLVSGISMEQPR